MTVEDPKLVDIVSHASDERRVALIVCDHLEFGSRERLWQLQEKINSYVAFVESGELEEKFPETTGSVPVINVAFVHEPDDEARLFLEEASRIVEGAGIGFEWLVHEDNGS